MMKKLLTTFGAFAIVMSLGSASIAEEEAHGEAGATPHYPIQKPKHVDWSFAGPFGSYDKAQLQRGLKVYTEVCAVCHSMQRVAFRSLEELGYSEEQVKAFAANYEVTDGPNADGEMFTRPATAADHFVPPYPNVNAATYANNGAYPPDMSLLAKARGVERGFPTFVFDIFTMYAEGGPDYIYSLLTGYPEDGEAPEGVMVSEGTYYNPYFINGASLAMAQPLYADSVTYDDGTPSTLEQQAEDVTAFLMWAAEPKLGERKQMGFRVMIFLLVFAAFLYLTKRQVFSRIEH